MNTTKEFFSPPQLAARLGVDVHKIHRWIKSGELVAINIAQKAGRRPRFRVSLASLERFERGRQWVPDPPQPPRRRRLPGRDVTEYF